MEINRDFINKEFKGKIDVQYYHKIFSEGKEIKAEWMLEPQKPENLVEDIFRKMLKSIGIPDDKFISQNRRRHRSRIKKCLWKTTLKKYLLSPLNLIRLMIIRAIRFSFNVLQINNYDIVFMDICRYLKV